MKGHFIFISLIITMLLGGCGVEREVEPVASTGNQEENRVEAVEKRMSHEVKEVSPLSFRYTVLNQSEKEVTFTFPSSQRFDYSIKDSNGEEVFLFSSVTSFLQVVGEETIEPGGQITYDIDVKELNLNKGDYTITVWMTPSTGAIGTSSTSFTVE